MNREKKLLDLKNELKEEQNQSEIYFNEIKNIKPYNLEKLRDSIQENVKITESLNTAIFNEENLYEHVNGQVESYLTYNTKGALVFSPKFSGNDEVMLMIEIYDMQSYTNAYGMFRFEMAGECGRLNLGWDNCKSGSIISVWHDRFYIKIMDYSYDNEKSHPIQEIAQQIINQLSKNDISRVEYWQKPPFNLAQSLIKDPISKYPSYYTDTFFGYEIFNNIFSYEALDENGGYHVFFGIKSLNEDLFNDFSKVISNDQVNVNTRKLLYDELYKGELKDTEYDIIITTLDNLFLGIIESQQNYKPVADKFQIIYENILSK